MISMNSFSAQTDKTDDKRYDLEVKTQKTAKEIAELETRIKGIKGKSLARFRSVRPINSDKYKHTFNTDPSRPTRS